MKKTLIVDSYAWIEYFKGSSEGGIVNNSLEEYDTIYTPVNVLAEVCEFFKKQNKDFEYAREVIESNSEIYPFSDDEWLEAIDKKIERRTSGIKNFGLMDARVMVCAENTNGKIITGDPTSKALRESFSLNLINRYINNQIACVIRHITDRYLATAYTSAQILASLGLQIPALRHTT